MTVRLIKHDAVPGTGSFGCASLMCAAVPIFISTMPNRAGCVRASASRASARPGKNVRSDHAGRIFENGVNKPGRQRIGSCPGCRISSALIIHANDSRL